MLGRSSFCRRIEPYPEESVVRLLTTHSSYAVGVLTISCARRECIYDTRMSAPRCDDIAYINYLIASPRTVTCTEAARGHPPQSDAPAHDAFSRLLYRADSDPEALWAEAKPLVHRR